MKYCSPVILYNISPVKQLIHKIENKSESPNDYEFKISFVLKEIFTFHD